MRKWRNRGLTGVGRDEPTPEVLPLFEDIVDEDTEDIETVYVNKTIASPPVQEEVVIVKSQLGLLSGKQRRAGHKKKSLPSWGFPK